MEGWIPSRFSDALRCFSFSSDLDDFLKREKRPIVKEVILCWEAAGEGFTMR